MPKLFTKGEVKVGDHVQLVATNTWPTKTAKDMKYLMFALKHHMGTVEQVLENDMVILQWDRPDAQVFYEQETNSAPIHATEDLKIVMKRDVMGQYQDVYFVMKQCPHCGKKTFYYDDGYMGGPSPDGYINYYWCYDGCGQKYTNRDIVNYFGMYADRFKAV